WRIRYGRGGRGGRLFSRCFVEFCLNRPFPTIEADDVSIFAVFRPYVGGTGSGVDGYWGGGAWNLCGDTAGRVPGRMQFDASFKYALKNSRFFLSRRVTRSQQTTCD